MEMLVTTVSLAGVQDQSCVLALFCGPWGNQLLHEQAGVPKIWSWMRVKNVMNNKKWLGTFVWSSLALISTGIFHTLRDLFQGIYIPYFALLEVIFWAFLFLQWRNQILVIITRHINLAGLRIFISVSLPGDVVWITFYVRLFLPNFWIGFLPVSSSHKFTFSLTPLGQCSCTFSILHSF